MLLHIARCVDEEDYEDGGREVGGWLKASEVI